ncbi:hypothetical protein MCOR31_009846 [Pyricularia oryzae]|nr:hypothetical protein MCOR31_009846 [Pyricularia oryzae]KAI6386418.1 hypothetical protein MCOR24_011296 [Pyricularia oryzae]
MPQLLPTSADAFVPQTSYDIVTFGSQVEPWLVETLRRFESNEPPDKIYLSKTLSSLNATWTLKSLKLRHRLESGSDRESWVTVHIEAFVDDISCNNVAFKLTQDTIKALTRYHQDGNCFDGDQHRKLDEDFTQYINSYVFWVPIFMFESLWEKIDVEQIHRQSENVKTSIMDFYKPPVAPPLKEVEPIRPPLQQNKGSNDGKNGDTASDGGASSAEVDIMILAQSGLRLPKDLENMS